MTVWSKPWGTFLVIVRLFAWGLIIIQYNHDHVNNYFNALMFNVLLGPRNFTVVNFKQRPTTLTLSHATLAH